MRVSLRLRILWVQGFMRVLFLTEVLEGWFHGSRAGPESWAAFRTLVSFVILIIAICDM